MEQEPGGLEYFIRFSPTWQQPFFVLHGIYRDLVFDDVSLSTYYVKVVLEKFFVSLSRATTTAVNYSIKITRIKRRGRKRNGLIPLFNLFVGENEARAGENLLPMCDANICFKSVRFCVSEKQRSVRETLGGLGVVQSEIGGQMHRQSWEVWGDVRQTDGG